MAIFVQEAWSVQELTSVFRMGLGNEKEYSLRGLDAGLCQTKPCLMFPRNLSIDQCLPPAG